MGFEDYYAAFTSDSHPSFSVRPEAGRMDRRGGEPTELTVNCRPQGRAGTFIGNLVINLPGEKKNARMTVRYYMILFLLPLFGRVSRIICSDPNTHCTVVNLEDNSKICYKITATSF